MSRPMIIETIRGAKNKHPKVRFLCACGNERMARASSVRRGLIDKCETCAKADAARRGGMTRRLPDTERIIREKFSIYKCNARAKGLSFSLSLAAFSAILDHTCEYCGGIGGGIDRVDSSFGYEAKNLVPCCSKCNYAKRDMSREEFLTWIEAVHGHQSLLQRDRSILLRMVEQSDGQGPYPTRSDLRQVDCRSDTRRCEAL